LGWIALGLGGGWWFWEGGLGNSGCHGRRISARQNDSALEVQRQKGASEFVKFHKL
jgi:hypothetical protein